MKFILVSFICLALTLKLSAQTIIDGISYYFTSGNAYVTYVNQEYSGEISIPNQVEYNGTLYNVKGIGEGAFSNSPELTNISIPEGITTIGLYAFSDCTGLSSIIIPHGVVKIDTSTFINCSNLSSISLPNSVTEICDDSFRDCSSLLSIYIPENVSNIASAFRGCSNLTEINVSPDNMTFCSVDGVLYDKNKTRLYKCPEGKNTLSIENSVTIVENYALSECSQLISINCNINTPPELGYNSFSWWFNLGYSLTDVDLNIPFYVPIGSKDLYEQAELFGDFTNILEGNFTSIKKEYYESYKIYLENGSMVVDNPDNLTLYIYDLHGRLLGSSLLTSINIASTFNLPKGLYIITIGNNSERILL